MSIKNAKRVAACLPVFAGMAMVFSGGIGEAANVTVRSIADANKYMEHIYDGYDYYYVTGSNNVLNIRMNDLGNYASYTFSAGPKGGGSGHTLNMYSGGGKYFSLIGSTLNNNSIVMTGGRVYEAVGAKQTTGNQAMSGNSVSISGGSVDFVYGAYATSSASTNIQNNHVTISGGTIGSSVYGASGVGTVNNNGVTVTGGSFDRLMIWGGYSAYRENVPQNEASENTISVSGFTANSIQIIGGEANGVAVATANKNKVILGEGIYTGNSVTGGEARAVSATADGNVVQVNGGTHSERIYTGYAVGKDTGTAIAGNNKLEINNGSLGGFKIYGGYATDGTTNIARGNQIIINGGTMTSTASEIIGALAYNGLAEDNAVIINGGTLAGSIYAADGEYHGKEKNNSISIYQKAALDMSKATLYGTRWRYSGDEVKEINATLNVYGSGITLKDVKYFANLNYYLPATVKNGDTIITATSTMSTDLEKTKVSVYVPGNTALHYGDTVNLFTNNKRIWWDGEVGEATMTEGVSIDYPITIGLNGDHTSLQAAIGSDLDGAAGEADIKLKDQTKSLVETASAGMAALNSGIDFVSSKGFSSAKEAAAGSVGSYAPFFAMGGSNMRYETGSHVDSKGYNFALGMAREIRGNRHTLLTGPFVEYGRASYDSYLDDGTHGSGHNRFTGVGWFLRNEMKSGLFYEASLRYGQLKNDYSGSGLMNTSYDSRSDYFGVHAGVGKRWTVGRQDNIELYGKFFHTHQQADDVKLSTGEQYHFSAINSNRTRLGLRYTHQASALCEVYSGLAWDYEFGSEARASYRGLSTPATSMKGSSGMMELGVKFKPTKTTPLTMDVSLQGWTGKQRGFAANAAFRWNF